MKGPEEKGGYMWLGNGHESSRTFETTAGLPQQAGNKNKDISHVQSLSDVLRLTNNVVESAMPTQKGILVDTDSFFLLIKAIKTFQEI